MDLIKRDGSLTEPEAKYFFTQILDAILFIDGKKLSHSDIKLENMLVSADFKLKISDFGFVSPTVPQIGIKGTPGYMAPEKLQVDFKYDPVKCDVFALGVVLFACIVGKYPFKLATRKDPKYKLLMEGKYTEFWELYGSKDKYTDDVKDLI